jgi:hypothetical protein
MVPVPVSMPVPFMGTIMGTITTRRVLFQLDTRQTSLEAA